MTDPRVIRDIALQHGLPGGPDHITIPNESVGTTILYPSYDCSRLVMREEGSPCGWLSVDCGVVRDLTEEQ